MMTGLIRTLRRLGLASLLALAAPVFGQEPGGAGSVFGQVREADTGVIITNVAVSIAGTPLRGVSGSDGRYSILMVPAGAYEVSFTRSDYERFVQREVRVVAGEATPLDVQLRLPMFELDLLEIMADPLAGLDSQLLLERQQSTISFDAIGAAQISRSGASDAAGVLAKVTGVTIQDGKSAVIRGLNERYTGTTLNGAEVPSANPYRKSVDLDLFPASMIDSVVVTKTFSPELPGNFTGGGINIKTKSFPEQFVFSASGELGYNTQATGNDEFLSYRGGGLDWLGMDDGARALPDELASPDVVVPFAPFSTGRPTAATFARRKADAETLEAQTLALGVTEFQARSSAPPPNHKLSLALGDTLEVGGRRLGYFVGLPYDRRYSHYDDGVARRFAPGVGGEFVLRKDFRDIRSLEEVTWAALVSVAYELTEHHELAFNFMHIQSAEDLVRRQLGTITDDPGTAFELNRLIYTERALTTYQLRGTHELPELAGLRTEWLGALASTTQDEPDARFFNFGVEGGRPVLDRSGFPEPRAPTRYFRDLAEDNANGKVDLTLPFDQWSGLEALLRSGFFISDSRRDFQDREFFYQGQSGETAFHPFTGDPNTYLTPENLGARTTTNATTGAINYTWDRYIQLRQSRYAGEQQVLAGYLGLELPLVESLKLTGGVRYETTDLSVASESYLANSITGVTTNRSELSQVDWLPAAGLIWSLHNDMAVRVNYSQTLARPTFRELAAYRGYDPLLDELLDGNPRLRMSSIQNYDLRWEWFPQPGEVIAVSLFYKQLTDAIERNFVTRDAEIVSFSNREEAEAYGVEFEVRKGLRFVPSEWGALSAGLNLTLIQSEVSLTPEELVAKREVIPNAADTRALYDQSPYILNADLNYDFPDTGTSLTVVFNIFGPRITIASLTTEDVFEQPAPVLDVMFRQKLGRSWQLRLSAKNLLNPAVERTYGESGDQLFSSHTRGRTFSLGLSYDF